jgi:glutamate-5-semialdehyde dehydrogenase
MDISQEVIKIAKQAKAASRRIASVSTDRKNNVLSSISRMLLAKKPFLAIENEKDLKNAKQQNLSKALIGRLTLDDRVIEDMAAGLIEVAGLPDPVGEVTRMWKRPNGLLVGRTRIPIGVIGMIFESRPNVTIDAAALCLKSGNAVILRGGKEAIHSNLALAGIMQEALTETGIDPAAVQVIPTTDRKAVMEMLKLKDYIDIIIPRGGESLIKTVYENSQIPVIAHYKGVCHVYIDATAKPEMAADIALNSKIQRPGVCNAMETLLVHRAYAEKHLPSLIDRFINAGVAVRGCDRACEIVTTLEKATESDWNEEYLDMILSVRVVENMESAIEHIACYGSNHTESIVTSDYENSRKFLMEVDSSAVFVNASTRFNDGNQLGLGAEIGISTSKLHAFGPMGLEELTTSKFTVYGNGQIRE